MRPRDLDCGHRIDGDVVYDVLTGVAVGVPARVAQRVTSGHDVDRQADDDYLASVLADANAPPVGAVGRPAHPSPSPRFLELDEFLGRDLPEYNWLIPDLLERGDRVILTGPEGGGKSTLLRQFAVQCASGIHPFGGEPFTPLRVTLLDLENSSRQVHRKLRPIRAAAGERYPGAMFVHVRPQGLDLLDAEDAEWLRALIDVTRPDSV